MAKKQPLLFELMKEEEHPQENQGAMDHFLRKTGPEAEARPQTETDVTAANVLTNDGPSKLYLRLNTYSLVLAITAALILLFCGYILGKKVGYRQGTRQRSNVQLSNVMASPSDSEVLEIFSTPSKIPPAGKKTVAQPEKTEKLPQIKDIFQKEGKITRKTGFNYLIIQNFGLDAKPIAELAKKFLAEQGILASVERSGRSFKLISAKGFESISVPSAEAFKRQIEAVGQEFKQKREAYGVSFKGCYYQKWK